MKSKMFWFTGLLGVILILAPFVLSYQDTANAQWSHVILGVVILVLSVIEALDEGISNWEYWATGVAGIVVVLAPFLFNFSASDQSTEMWTSIILGAVTAILAGYEVFKPKPETQ